MQEKNRVWQLLKYISLAIIVVMLIVLLAQYISLAKLNKDKILLENQLIDAQTEQQEKEKLLEYYGTDEFIEDQAKENFNMKNKDEEVIIAKN